jgi:hypothetical protein
MVLVPEHVRSEPVFEESTSTAVAVVEALRIDPVQPLHPV